MKYLITIIIVLSISMIGCESSDDDSPTGVNGNSAPVIQSVTANPNTIVKGGGYAYTTLTCVATDADGDSLNYSWTSSVGRFLDGVTIGQSVKWYTYGSNTDVGNYFISVIASDGKAVARDSVSVQIVP